MYEEPIIFKAHDPRWAIAFEHQSSLLQKSLGKYIAAVHHVGSTAVADIEAKPVIDIAIESPVYPPDENIIDTLLKQGFIAHGDGGVVGRCWFSKGVPRIANLHWCPVGGKVVQSQIQFRDALREDRALADEYETLKKLAAHGRYIDSAEYAAEKNKFVAKVLSLGS